jgi:DNA-binding response OmpR family regulator
MTTAPRAEKLTLFLAEDEEGTATLLKFLLARGGYTVVHAADGQQAQTMIDQMPPPALVLLDIMLPYLNGLQLLAHIRQKADWQHVPIIMLTADSNERDIEQALAAGANDYIVKPFNPRELTARLQRFLRVAS